LHFPSTRAIHYGLVVPPFRFQMALCLQPFQLDSRMIRATSPAMALMAGDLGDGAVHQLKTPVAGWPTAQIGVR
jgi:hypothetical protein